MNRNFKKPLIFIFMLAIIFAWYFVEGVEYLNLSYLKSKLEMIISFKSQSPLYFSFIFFTLYILLTGLSLPGSLLLTMLAGYIFGTWIGTAFVAVAGGIGALTSFLISRYLLRNFIEKKYKNLVNKMNQSLNKSSTAYLLSLRLLPVSPYVVVNLVMGLSRMSPLTFFWVTVVGMLPGNFIYTYAGKTLASIQSVSEIMSYKLISMIFLLGLIPLVINRILLKKQKTLHCETFI